MSISNHELIHQREQMLHQETDVTATPAARVRTFCGLPYDCGGLTVVDLGAGGSDLTATLRREGALAYAVDAHYGSVGRIRSGVGRFYAQSRERYARNPLLGMLERILGDNDQRELFTAATFERSFREHPDWYIQGWLTRVPLPDDYANWVISLCSIINFLKDRDLFTIATDEAYRITKPEGILVIAPYIPTLAEKRGTSTEWDHQVRRLTRLNDGGVVVEPVVEDSDSVLRLRLVKRKPYS